MVEPKSLREIYFFSDLNDNELGVISKVLKEKDFKTGATVFKEGEDGQSLYIIKRGEVKACKSTPEGDLLTLMLHKDGEIFGEMSFLDGRPRSATIVAITDTKTYVLEQGDFETLVDNHPRLIYKLLKNIVFHIHSIVRGMNSRYLEMINYMWGRKR
ncbi:MAG: cyclic nucleotide-binding domain-containing protein [Nitrospirae bacterium]|nr:cyclic nucleotide-binding domain-containing protein [Nitrospirota bacterium]